MKITIYRSLGVESTFLGIQESYIRYFLLVLLGGLAVALIVGSFLTSFFGFATFVIVLIADYFGVLYVQEKWSIKELGRYLTSRKLPDHVVFGPRRLDTYVSRWTPDGRSSDKKD